MIKWIKKKKKNNRKQSYKSYTQSLQTVLNPPTHRQKTTTLHACTLYTRQLASATKTHQNTWIKWKLRQIECKHYGIVSTEEQITTFTIKLYKKQTFIRFKTLNSPNELPTFSINCITIDILQWISPYKKVKIKT